MGLREQATKDLTTTLADVTGFAVPLSFFEPVPSASAEVINGWYADTEMGTDIDTGSVVNNRHARCSVRISDILAKYPLPNPGPTGGPTDGLVWRVEAPDAQGTLHMYEITRALPNIGLGVLDMELGVYGG